MLLALLAVALAVDHRAIGEQAADAIDAPHRFQKEGVARGTEIASWNRTPRSWRASALSVCIGAAEKSELGLAAAGGDVMVEAVGRLQRPQARRLGARDSSARGSPGREHRREDGSP